MDFRLVNLFSTKDLESVDYREIAILPPVQESTQEPSAEGQDPKNAAIWVRPIFGETLEPAAVPCQGHLLCYPKLSMLRQHSKMKSANLENLV